MTDAFIALDRQWRVSYMNGAAVRLNGKPRSKTLGRSHWDEWPHTVGSEVERLYRQAMTTQRPVHFEHHYMVPGRDFWHQIHAYPDENGLSIFFRDVTEQKRDADLARLLVKAGAEFAASLDQKSTIRVVAHMALPLLGQWSCVYLIDESNRATDVEIAAIDPRHIPLLNQLASRIMAASDPASVLAEGIRPLAPLSWLNVPLVARGRTIGAITFGMTETGRPHDEQDEHAAREVALPAALALDNARLYDAAIRARRDAEEANKSKANFLSTMSHELRTPLNAIGGYVQLLQMGVRGPLTDQQRKDLDRIERNQQHVAGLVNDVLNFARLEAGRVEFDCKRVAVSALLAELEGFVAPLAAEGGQVLSIRPCAPETALVADPDRAMQILLNLANNAIKFTPKGSGIEIFVDEIEPADAGKVRISVHDDGPGIPPDKQESIFEPFVQIGRRLDAPAEGIGLGLAIARDLARGMGGDLTVESAPGRGATVTLSLPTLSSSSELDPDDRR